MPGPARLSSLVRTRSTAAKLRQVDESSALAHGKPRSGVMGTLAHLPFLDMARQTTHRGTASRSANTSLIEAMSGRENPQAFMVAPAVSPGPGRRPALGAVT